MYTCTGDAFAGPGNPLAACIAVQRADLPLMVQQPINTFLLIFYSDRTRQNAIHVSQSTAPSIAEIDEFIAADCRSAERVAAAAVVTTLNVCWTQSKFYVRET
jgi:hypothetical protein